MANNSANRNALITQFITLTNVTPDAAKRTLEACNWNLQSAVNMFKKDSSDSSKESIVKSSSMPKSSSNKPKTVTKDQHKSPTWLAKSQPSIVTKERSFSAFGNTNTGLGELFAELQPSGNSTTTAGSWKQYLGPEGGKQVQLAIRFAEGKRESISFPEGTKVKALLMYLTEQYGINMTHFDVFTVYPKKNLNSDCDEMATLEAVGIRSRDMLYLNKKM